MPSIQTLFPPCALAFILTAPAAAQDVTDITDSILTSRAGDCASYVGRYQAEVHDHVNDRTVQGQLRIESSDDSCTFIVNQIPNHDFGQNVRWPHKPAENKEEIVVPRNPTMANDITKLGLSPGAILLNGVKWEPNPAACFGVGRDSAGKERIGCGPRDIDNPWRYNVGSALNEFRFDDYHAHVQKGGLYHYHATPRVLYSTEAKLMTDADCHTAGESPVIGFALDGFPLYGPCIEDETGKLRLAQSSYMLKSGERVAVGSYATPYVAGVVASSEYNGQFIGDYEYLASTGDLDECNGATIDGQYGYYATNEFPYAMRCLKGTALMPIR